MPSFSRLVEWLRDQTIKILLDLLCWVLPANVRYTVTIETTDEESMISVIEAPQRRRQ